MFHNCIVERERERERERVKQRNETQRTRYDSTMVTYGNNMNDDLHSTQQQFQFVKRLLQDDNNETEFTSSNTTTTNDIVPGEGTGNSTMAPSMVPISSPTTATSPASSPTAYDNEKTSFPISSPSYSMDYPAGDRYSPTAATDYTTNDTSVNYTNIVMNPFYGTIIACTIGIIIIFIAWKFCKRWKSRRERQMLRLQSSRVDAVLGDMQVRLFFHIYIYIYIYRTYVYMCICIYIYLLYN